jgi:hypothetical protein
MKPMMTPAGEHKKAAISAMMASVLVLRVPCG